MTKLEIILSILCVLLYIFGAWIVSLLCGWQVNKTRQLLFTIFWPLAIVADMLIDFYHRVKDKS